LLAGGGKITLNSKGLKYYGSGTVSEIQTIEWYDTSNGDRPIGRIKSDYGGTFGATWVEAWKNTGDPWTYPVVILSAYDVTQSKNIRLYVRTIDSDIYSLSPFTTGSNFALNPATAPSTRSPYAQIYVDTADGDLKVKFGNGVVKTIATN